MKSVQAMLTPLMVLLLIPYFLTLFLDLSQVPTALRWIVMAIPFTYPFLAGPNLFLGNYGAVWFGIAYQLLWFGGTRVHRRADLLERPDPDHEAESPPKEARSRRLSGLRVTRTG